MKSGLRLPTEIAPPASPYAQRAQDQREAILPRMGGSDETEKAVALALAWLARHQSPDGHWDGQHFDAACNQCTGQTDMRVNTALTGLSLLAFLGADHTHMKEGAYRDNVRRGIAWLLRQQKTDGDLRGDETMYSHGIATIALSEAYAMTGDSRLREHVRTAAEFIVAARNLRQGGWRYEPGQAADTSVTGWQVMALKSARNAGLSIDGAGFESARQWMERVASGRHSGLYAYRPRQQPTPAMTAEGMFIQQLLGVPREEPRMRESAAFVIRNLPDWDNALNTYYWYYATLALFQHQGDEWLRWNRALVKQLLPHQAKEGGQAGSWEPGGEWAPVGGRVYQTAICTLMLEVYYRYLPLYTLDRPPGSLGAIRGRVTDGEHKPLAGVTIRLEMPGLDPTVVQTGVDGRYLMQPPGKDVPDHVAITATHDGYDPQAANVPGHRLRDGDVVQDFQLSPHDKDLVSIEAVPELHHLGNNAFEGSINSQFQKQAEGDEYETTFELTAGQLAGAESAELTLLAKGVQCPHEIRINDNLLETRFERTPRDGSFGPLTFEVPVELLEGGTNALHIQAIECTGDLDDFEFINVQLRLVR